LTEADLLPLIAAAFGHWGCGWLRALVDIALTSMEPDVAVRHPLAKFSPAVTLPLG
jgi:hypothetical protein